MVHVWLVVMTGQMWDAINREDPSPPHRTSKLCAETEIEHQHLVAWRVLRTLKRDLATFSLNLAMELQGCIMPSVAPTGQAGASL